MKIDFKNQISSIIDACQFLPPKTLLVNGNSIQVDLLNKSAQRRNETVYHMGNLFYANFYCRGTVPKEENGLSGADDPAVPDAAEFLQQLQAANHSQDRFDHGWSIHSIDRDGGMLVQKWNFIRQVKPGEFIKEGLGGLYPGERVMIWLKKEWKEENSAFYYVFGNTLGDGEGMHLSRIYFNLKFSGSAKLIKSLTTHFNHHKIPFHFKCVQQPDRYSRTDSAVLYLSKRYANIAMQVLSTFYNDLKPHLNAGIPLFCKRLGKGIGFAENPPNSGDSFGMSRSNLLADGILKAIEKQISKKDWLQEVLHSIEANNLKVDKFYLNPKTEFPYQFQLFE